MGKTAELVKSVSQGSQIFFIEEVILNNLKLYLIIYLTCLDTYIIYVIAMKGVRDYCRS